MCLTHNNSSHCVLMLYEVSKLKSSSCTFSVTKLHLFKRNPTKENNWKVKHVQGNSSQQFVHVILEIWATLEFLHTDTHNNINHDNSYKADTVVITSPQQLTSTSPLTHWSQKQQNKDFPVLCGNKKSKTGIQTCTICSIL